jgi:hypothetical protein
MDLMILRRLRNFLICDDETSRRLDLVDHELDAVAGRGYVLPAGFRIIKPEPKGRAEDLMEQLEEYKGEAEHQIR